MRVLVTGGTGFIGSHLVEALLARGDSVRCLVRRPDRPGWLAGLNVEVVAGAVDRPASLPSAVDGVDAVLHLAGVVTARDRSTYFGVNADGTRRLLEACAAARRPLRRFVTAGSQAGGGPSLDGRPVEEAEEPRPVTWYGESKLAAERATLEFSRTFPVAVVRPCAIYGPREREILSFFRMISKGVAVLIGTGKRANFLHVDDCVRGILAALDHPAACGRVYNLSDDEGPAWETLVGAMSRAVGKQPKVIRITDAAARGIGSAVGGLLGALGVSTPLTPQKLTEITQRWWLCSNARARRELGWAPRVPLEEGLSSTARWYLSRGWL
ncbi:MAG: NAD(P)-dependent oxidoreductase [Planctomycetes bacterium]|nr:NAD(P)-dependent oxidoreductase [Planctomycetota bacterium]